jgi:hypothetical protein
VAIRVDNRERGTGNLKVGRGKRQGGQARGEDKEEEERLSPKPPQSPHSPLPTPYSPLPLSLRQKQF